MNHAQRLREALYKLWEEHKGDIALRVHEHVTFERFYQESMEKIIKNVESRIPINMSLAERTSLKKEEGELSDAIIDKHFEDMAEFNNGGYAV